MASISFKKNMQKHEIIGSLLIFIGATWLGFGLYATFLAANRILINFPLLSTNQLLIFPLFYGLGAILLMFGIIELREMRPGKNRS